jgi:replicative DNA helicase
MTRALLKSLLNHDFYQANRPRLRESIFASDDAQAYRLIAKGHERYQHDLSAQDVLSLWSLDNPVATSAEREDFIDVLQDIKAHEEISPDIAKDTIEGLWQREIGREIANLGIYINEGNLDGWQKLQALIQRVNDGFMPDDFGDPTTDDLYQLLAETSDDARWKFNIETLARRVYGIGPSEFGIVFARPETGKSAFVVSITTGPSGFCSQGARVLYLGNEEATRRTKLRAIQAWTGMTREEIAQNPDVAETRYIAIRDRLIMKDAQEWDMEKVDAYCKKIKPDVLILDQLDKVNISGTFGATHEKLREVYRQARELAKRHECALLGVSQASAEAENRTRLDFSMLDGSKTGKAAEADLIIGIGRHSGEDDDGPDTTRFITISKNKLSGWHGNVICNIQAEISRYVE